MTPSLVIQEINFLIPLGRLAEAGERMPARVPGDAISYASLFWRDQRARLALLSGDLEGARAELQALDRMIDRAIEPQWVEPRTDMTVELALSEDRLAEARAAVGHAAPQLARSDQSTRLTRLGGSRYASRPRRPGAPSRSASRTWRSSTRARRQAAGPRAGAAVLPGDARVGDDGRGRAGAVRRCRARRRRMPAGPIGLAGEAPSPAADDSPAARLGLTPRELEVLRLVAEGCTNRAIGETLFMSEKTASVHVSRILVKLGVGGRVEGAAVAHRLGLTAVAPRSPAVGPA